MSDNGFDLRWVVDGSNPRSPAVWLRRSRFAFFRSVVNRLPQPVRILDVGGSISFWEAMGFAASPGCSITILNVEHRDTHNPAFRRVYGDARDLSCFRDNSFDLVFSNSTIEHVGDFVDQRRMASEVTRVGKLYFVQTPNRNFPIEPHFLFPFFFSLPSSLQSRLLRRTRLGWFKRCADDAAARKVLDSVHALTEDQVIRLFPSALLYRERLLGLSKSFTVVGPAPIVAALAARRGVLHQAVS